MKKLALVVTIPIEPGHVDAVVEALKAHAARSLNNEPGTLQFDVILPIEEDDVAMLYEVYVDEAAFAVHSKAESLAILRKDVAGKVGSMSAVRCAVQN